MNTCRGEGEFRHQWRSQDAYLEEEIGAEGCTRYALYSSSLSGKGWYCSPPPLQRLTCGIRSHEEETWGAKRYVALLGSLAMEGLGVHVCPEGLSWALKHQDARVPRSRGAPTPYGVAHLTSPWGDLG